MREITSDPDRRAVDIECPSQESRPGLVPSSKQSLDTEASNHTHGYALLEDWPQRYPCFGDSNVRKYAVNEARIRQSYSSQDRRRFQMEAIREACRVRNLMATCPHGYRTGGKATVYLIQHDILSVEEMIGIENLISDASAKNSLKERHLHTALVLKKQRELREQNEVDNEKLGEIARLRSSKNVERARLRALLAAPRALLKHWGPKNDLQL
ncbi:hypothetical protein HJC23_004245 [Cyclotella cryptica]|uniref:Uncharacterized protein n=1 Tax=Cyclotella cryptica TaxID=29204 RepID=A0ABD3Q7N7_9STRA